MKKSSSSAGSSQSNFMQKWLSKKSDFNSETETVETSNTNRSTIINVSPVKNNANDVDEESIHHGPADGNADTSPDLLGNQSNVEQVENEDALKMKSNADLLLAKHLDEPHRPRNCNFRSQLIGGKWRCFQPSWYVGIFYSFYFVNY